MVCLFYFSSQRISFFFVDFFLWSLLFLLHLFISALIFKISFLLLTLEFFISSFSRCFRCAATATAAKSLQSCPTLCDPIDGSPPGYPVPGILQARTLAWVSISFSSAWKWKVKVKSLSRVRLFRTPWTAAYQAPLSMGFSRQEYWRWVPLPSPALGVELGYLFDFFLVS